MDFRILKFIFVFLLLCVRDFPILHASDQNIVMYRGNYQVSGLPFFPENSFRGLFGEYRFEPEDGGEEGSDERRFFIWLYNGKLFFDNARWRGRPNVTGAVQREDGDLLAVAVEIDAGTYFGTYTVLFGFPRKPDGAGLSESQTNSLIDVWIKRFLYFRSLARLPADISLPAIISF